MFHRFQLTRGMATRGFFLLYIGLCWTLATSLAFAQISDEEGLRLRRERMPKKNVAQQIVDVPTHLVKLPFLVTGKGIRYTLEFIDETDLLPRAKAFLTSDDELVALYPTIGFGGRSGLIGELKFFDKKFLKKGNRLSLQTSLSTERHQNHFVRYQVPELIGPLFMDGRGGYQVITNEDFFGIGHESDRANRTNFRHEKLGGTLTLGTAWTKSFRTRLRIDYTDHVLEDGDGTSDSTLVKFDRQTAPGLEGAALLGVGGGFAFDTRDNDFYPSKGGLAEFSTTLLNQVDGEDYGFIRYTLELSRYVTLFRRGRIFAIRLLGEVNTQISDKETPFFERASLGGGSDLRGYSTGRFRDKDLILLNLEYRYPIWDSSVERRGAMDAVIFADIGQVFDDLMEETFKDYKISYGVGIRARTPQDFVLRAEIALSSEETNFIFKFEPMF